MAFFVVIESHFLKCVACNFAYSAQLKALKYACTWLSNCRYKLGSRCKFSSVARMLIRVDCPPHRCFFPETCFVFFWSRAPTVVNCTQVDLHLGLISHFVSFLQTDKYFTKDSWFFFLANARKPKPSRSAKAKAKALEMSKDNSSEKRTRSKPAGELVSAVLVVRR